MTIHIPEWLLWTLGIGIGVPAFFLLCLFAVIGVSLLEGFRR
jgi:hypothetical protein